MRLAEVARWLDAAGVAPRGAGADSRGALLALRDDGATERLDVVVN